MSIETVKVKDSSGKLIIVNKEDAKNYAEFNKPKKAPIKRKADKK